MIDVGAESAAPGAGTAEKALSFISRGWREVRDSAGADLRLMRARASSFKSLADREFENLLSSSAAVLSTPPRPSPPEVEFVKRIQPKLSEIRRDYSSPDFSRRVLEKWSPKATIRIDLSAIRNAIVSEVDEVGAVLDVGKVKGQSWRMVRWKGVEEEEQRREWEPIRILKTGLKELERKSQSTSNELVEKLKSSLGSFVKEPQESKEVPPLDLPELLAYFVKQSGPFFNQLGIRQDICDKIVEALCSRRKDQLMYHSLSAKDTSLPGNENSDELDLRIASVLESMTLVNKMVKPRVIGAFKMCRVEIPTFSSYESLVIRVEKWTSWTSY